MLADLELLGQLCLANPGDPSPVAVAADQDQGAHHGLGQPAVGACADRDDGQAALVWECVLELDLGLLGDAEGHDVVNHGRCAHGRCPSCAA